MISMKRHYMLLQRTVRTSFAYQITLCHFIYLQQKLGHANVVEVLADNGANLCARSNSSFTPLMAAIENGRESVIDVLLEYQANENCTGNDIDSLLLFAISTSKQNIVLILKTSWLTAAFIMQTQSHYESSYHFVVSDLKTVFFNNKFDFDS